MFRLTQTNLFVDRIEKLNKLQLIVQAILDTVVFIAGVGGMGKTHLVE